MIHLTQENRQTRIDTPLGNDVLMLQHFSGTEALSQNFRYNMTVLSEDDSMAVVFAAQHELPNFSINEYSGDYSKNL
jgi:uncharacterized protein involved in type VI secretion and phage assembly